MLSKKRETVKTYLPALYDYPRFHNSISHPLTTSIDPTSSPQLAQKGSLQISRVLARYDTKTPLEEVETAFEETDEGEEEITTDKIDFR